MTDADKGLTLLIGFYFATLGFGAVLMGILNA